MVSDGLVKVDNTLLINALLAMFPPEQREEVLEQIEQEAQNDY